MTAKINLPFKFNTAYKHKTKKDGDPVSLKMIFPTFSKDPFAQYERCNKYPSIPVRMVIDGATSSGKSELIKRIHQQDPVFYCQRDGFL